MATTRWNPGPTVVLVLMFFIAAIPRAAVAQPVVAVPSLAHYALEVAFDPASRTLAGSLDVTWTNTTPVEHEGLPFRLYPNADYYGEGDLAVTGITVDGEPSFLQLSFDPTVVVVDLGEPVEPGGAVTVGLEFTTIVPEEPGASFGILAGNDASGWRLADWYPVIAGWEDGGWYLAAPTPFGDPTFPEAATWDLTLTAPSGLAVIASGDESIASTDGETTTTRVVSGPGREMTVTLLPVDPVESTGEAGGVSIVASSPSDAEILEEIVATATEALPVLASWMGEYPATELDIVLAPLHGAPAVSWNGLIWVDPGRFPRDGDMDWLRFTLLHELAHQWVPGVAGSNNNDHGFLSEGLATTLAILAARETEGVDVAAAWLERFVASGYRQMLSAGLDGVADAPLTGDADLAIRNTLVYGKAPLGFEAIRQEIGDEAFFGGLGAYTDAFRHRMSGPADLRAAWEAASGRDLGDLWRFWFDEATATPADIDRVFAGFA